MIRSPSLPVAPRRTDGSAPPQTKRKRLLVHITPKKIAFHANAVQLAAKSANGKVKA